MSQNLLFATAVADLGDLDGDGVTDVLSGRIHFAPSGGIYGGDGQVFVLSGETGRILNVFDERNYPTISLEHYLALHDR